jgi:Leucine-rich repeat (LRR) protein/ABC-type glycerol-3-phosphate transport system substrate-binding protein
MKSVCFSYTQKHPKGCRAAEGRRVGFCLLKFYSAEENMKANVLFRGLARAFLMVVIIVMVGGFLALPNHTVFAKPSAAAFIDCASQTEIPVAECNALAALYNSTDGANWGNNTGWLQTDTPCSWFRVSCVDGHVTQLRMDWNNLSGIIPNQLDSLSNLTELDLNGNQLSGSIPPELDSLTNLTVLNLGNNQLTGSIPTQLGNLTQLEYLYLYGNQLTGSIPSELGSLTQLEYLYLSGNQLTGFIPAELGGLTQLTNLALSGNQLTGSIPIELGSLTNLHVLHLGGNQLTGSIPTELGNLTNLHNLYLSMNQLTGSIPTQLGNLVNLVLLDLSRNQLTGSIPTELGNLINLTELNLILNQLTGSIPAQLGNLTNLTNLTFDSNQLTGSIPIQLGNLTNLTMLSVNDNQLSGSIPPELGNITNLTWLDLSNNQLSGSIPGELGNLINLTWMNLSSNQLTGSIPPELGSLTNVYMLSLQLNQLNGSIPGELGSLTNLYTLSLNNNQLTGSIPAQLGSITRLQSLGLSNNQLSGSIPGELGNLINLTWLELGNNQLSGSISSELGSLTNLYYLHLNNNQLTGSIPGELGNLTKLYVLYLNNNQLTGPIPTEVGNLTQIGYLSLNNNQLSGEIPASITNLINLAELSIDCGFTSSDPVVIAFLNGINPDWSCNPTFTPRMIADPVRNWVRALGWPDGTSLTLTVDDPSNGVGVDKIVNSTMAPNDGDPNDIVADFELGSFDLQSGHIVKITDGTTEDQYTLTSLAITGFDLDADTISGIATPGVQVEIGVNMPENNVSRYVTPDATGHWTADYAHPGASDDEQELVDLQSGSNGWAAESDTNGHQTWVPWHIYVPNPYIYASPNGYVRAYDWPNGTPLTLTIDNPSNGVGADKTVNATMGQAPWNPGDPNDIVADFNLGSFNIQPGYILKVTDGATPPTERTYTLSNLAITGFDLDADTVSGIATPGVEIEVCANVLDFCVSRRVTPAVGTGIWTVDYGHIGATPGDEPQLVDLQPGNNGWSTQRDASGNRTRVDWRVLNPHFYARITQNNMEGNDWPVGASVTLTIDDPGNETGVDFTDTQVVDGGNTVRFNSLGGLTLAPGMEITMTDGTTTRTMIVSPLTATVDLANDTISGTADPNSPVNVWVGGQPGGYPMRRTTADSLGNWQVDFSAPDGNNSDEQWIIDIRPGMSGEVRELEDEYRDFGNATSVQWQAFAPVTRAFYLKASAAANWVHAYGWLQGASLTLKVSRAGIEYYNGAAAMAQAPWNPNTPSDLVAVFDLNGQFDLQPGDILAVADGITTRIASVPSQMTQVRWFIGVGTTGNDPGQLPAEFSVVDDYNQAHANIELVVDIEPSNTAADTLTAQINAGHAPDIVGPTGWAASSPFHGKWLNLTQLIQNSGFDTSIFTPALVSMYHTDEGQVALPFAVYPSALYYNPALFDAAGLHYPPAHYGDQYQMPDGTMKTWSWETLMQVAKLLTRDSNGKNASQPGFDRDQIVQYGFSFGYEGPHPKYVGSFWQSGNLLQGTEGNYSAQVPDAWKAAWSWVYDGIWGDQPYIPNGIVSASSDFGSGNVFDSGKIAMLDSPAWYTCCVNNLINTGGTFQLGAMPSYNGQVAGRIDADTFRIPKNSAHPEQAFDVLSYLVTSGVDKLIVGTPDMPPAYGFAAVPAAKDKQQAYPFGRASQFPFVTQDSWNVLLAGLNYPDVPSAESWMPNFWTAWDRLQSFANHTGSTPGLNLDDEIANLQTDLQRIFNDGQFPPLITEGASTSVTMSQNDPSHPFHLTLHATDADGDTLTWSISAPATHGTASAGGVGASKNISYTPNTNYFGPDAFVVQVADSQGGQDTITVHVTISGAVVLAVLPAAPTANVGQAFNLTVQVQAGAQQVDGAAAYLNFDPAYFQVVSLSSGATLPVVIQNAYDNTTGRIDYAAGILGSSHPSGSFTLVTINFMARAPTSGAALTFNDTLPRKSDASFGGYSAMNHAENGMVVITNFATLNGQIALQGRPAAPDPRWVTALTVSLTAPGESAPRYTFTPITDASGRFSIGSIPPGTYEARVKNSHTLQNKLTVTLVNGDNAINFGTLREGDANNDNFVSLVDFSILASTFGKCQGATGYDDRADFNEDQCVSLLDFSLLSTNFGQAGAAAMQTQALNPVAGNVQLAIAPATVKVVSGQVFSVTVQVKAGTQRVDAAQASLDFNPTLLQVRRLTAGTALPLSLQSQFDNAAGTIDFAAGTLSNFPSGTFTLVTVEFQALTPTTGTDLAFHFGLPRDAGVTFAGKSVLGQTNSGRIVVTLPITATFASNARNDGWILESSENSSKGGSLNSAATFFNLGDDAANKQYRGLLHFDTSSLPDNAVITSVTLKIKQQRLVGTNPFSTHGALLADVRKPFFGATAGLELGDFRAVPSKLAAAAFGAAPVSGWYNAVIGSANYPFINLNGPTQFRLRFTKDDDNDHVADFMQFYSGSASAANRPQLVITYYAP